MHPPISSYTKTSSFFNFELKYLQALLLVLAQIAFIVHFAYPTQEHMLFIKSVCTAVFRFSQKKTKIPKKSEEAEGVSIKEFCRKLIILLSIARY